MSLTVNIFYSGKDGAAIKFANEVIASGLINRIRAEEGNLGYEYYLSIENKEEVLLIDKWVNQEALDKHHKSIMMEEINKLRNKYNLRLKIYKYYEQEE